MRTKLYFLLYSKFTASLA